MVCRVMSMNAAKARLEALVRRHERRLPSKLPNAQQTYVLEVEPTHLERVRDIISQACGSNDAVLAYMSASRDADSQVKKSVPPGLLFTSTNAPLNGNLPAEFIKYLTRHFFVPHSCYDADWLLAWVLANAAGKKVQEEQGALVLKISASPKELEAELIEALANYPCMNLHQTKYTHLLQVVFSVEESCFRWGLSTAQFAEENLLTHDALTSALEASRRDTGTLCALSSCVPVCRAYYKVLEIFEQQFSSVLHWPFPDASSCVSCDVGAAPGGWTQVLSRHSFKVIAIDPGQLAPDVLALPNVHYIAATLQNANVEAALAESDGGKLKMIVCDVNFEPRQTAEMLCEYVLGFLDGMRPSGDHNSACCSASPSYVILTLKMMKKPLQRHIDIVVKRVLEIFQHASAPHHGNCWKHHVVHLTANSRNERTLLLRLH